jgi:hypothetical protein
METKFDNEVTHKEFNSNLIVKGDFKDLIANRIYLKNLLLFFIQWIVGIYSFYTLYFMLKYIEGDIYTNVIIAGLSEMASTLAVGLILQRFGLNKTYFLSNLTGAVCSLLYTLIGPLFPSLIPLLILGSFFGFCSAILLNWVGAPYLFPVIYATSTQGFSNIFSRLATILAPQMAELE